VPAPRRYPDLKVFGILADFTACGHYRMINPFSYLRALKAEITLGPYADPSAVDKADIVVVQRMHASQVAQLVEYAQSRGKRVYYEVDDNLHAVMPSSPVYGLYHPGSPVLKGIEQLIAKCDGLTVSTPDLAEMYSRYNSNVAVIPNSIDFEIRDWTSVPQDRKPGRLVAGWAGGSTHLEDLQILRPAVKAMLAKYDHVDFGIYANEQMAKSIIEGWELDPDRVKFIPPRDFKEFPSGLGYFDIGLAPIVSTAFNAAKSNLKVIEYGARSIPCVASVSAPYSSTIKNGVNGFLARSSQEWESAIDILVGNETVRARMGAAIKELVLSRFSMLQNVHLWPAAWKDLGVRASLGVVPQTLTPLFGSVGRNDACPCGSGQKYKRCCVGAWG